MKNSLLQPIEWASYRELTSAPWVGFSDRNSPRFVDAHWRQEQKKLASAMIREAGSSCHLIFRSFRLCPTMVGNDRATTLIQCISDKTRSLVPT
jgi:hypothetical protein